MRMNVLEKNDDNGFVEFRKRKQYYTGFEEYAHFRRHLQC